MDRLTQFLQSVLAVYPLEKWVDTWLKGLNETDPTLEDMQTWFEGKALPPPEVFLPILSLARSGSDEDRFSEDLDAIDRLSIAEISGLGAEHWGGAKTLADYLQQPLLADLLHQLKSLPYRHRAQVLWGARDKITSIRYPKQ